MKWNEEPVIGSRMGGKGSIGSNASARKEGERASECAPLFTLAKRGERWSKLA
jgi:hypothetical protein